MPVPSESPGPGASSAPLISDDEFPPAILRFERRARPRSTQRKAKPASCPLSFRVSRRITRKTHFVRKISYTFPVSSETTSRLPFGAVWMSVTIPKSGPTIRLSLSVVSWNVRLSATTVSPAIRPAVAGQVEAHEAAAERVVVDRETDEEVAEVLRPERPAVQKADRRGRQHVLPAELRIAVARPRQDEEPGKRFRRRVGDPLRPPAELLKVREVLVVEGRRLDLLELGDSSRPDP